MRAALALVLLAAALGGCASPGARPVETRSIAAGATSTAIDVVGDLSPGGSVRLPPGNALGARTVHLVDDYAAASGRHCRRVALDEPDGPRRIVCRRADGRWSATRSLTRPDHAPRPALGAAAASSPVTGGPRPTIDPLPTPSVETIGAGETLWGFAERTTGRGENWPDIARANAIEDPARVEAGRVLELPVGLPAAR